MPVGPIVTVSYPGGGKEIQEGEVTAPKPTG